MFLKLVCRGLHRRFWIVVSEFLSSSIRHWMYLTEWYNRKLRGGGMVTRDSSRRDDKSQSALRDHGRQWKAVPGTCEACELWKLSFDLVSSCSSSPSLMFVVRFWIHWWNMMKRGSLIILSYCKQRHRDRLDGIQIDLFVSKVAALFYDVKIWMWTGIASIMRQCVVPHVMSHVRRPGKLPSSKAH